MMEPILRPDERLQRMEYPELVVLEDDELPEGTLFILCAGFEDRSRALADRLGPYREKQHSALVVDYLPLVPENRRREMTELLNASKIEVDHLTYDRQAPAGAGEQIALRIEEHPGPTVIDVSGMSRLLIVQILSALCERDSLAQVSIAYTEAEHYPPSKEDFESALDERALPDIAFLSSGVFDLTLVPELSSGVLPQRPIHAILFPSFNPTQVLTMFSEVQAARWTVIFGVPPSPDMKWRTQALAQLNQIEVLPPSSVENLSTLDYRDTLTALLRAYQDSGVDHRIVVAPTGSKMQTVAVGLARGFLSDLQIAYPTPVGFQEPSHYTKGARETYILPLAPFAEIRERTLNRPRS